MEKEWQEKYNPFNSMKSLIWREHMEGCANGNFLPPVTVDIDVTGACNLKCIWCNFADYLEKTEYKDISEEHLIRIADFVAGWGVKGACLIGGEPLMNPATGKLLERLKFNGTQASMITNGLLLNDEIIATIAKSCRWVGISLDAANGSTYSKVKGCGEKSFDVVIKNIEKLCSEVKRTKSTCDVGVKFLIHPLNALEIYDSAKLVKSLGVRDFHVRPAGWENVQNANIVRFDFNDYIEDINNQIQKAFELETESFHVYGVKHKFDPNFNKAVNFSRCLASPLVLVFAPDGNCYTCGDRRGQKEFILCSHYPNVENVRKCWNSDKHRKIIESTKLNECPRCVLGPYHEAVEKVFINDRMCRCFL